MVNSKWPPRSKVKVTHLLDHFNNVTIRFAMVENLYMIEFSFLLVLKRSVLVFGEFKMAAKVKDQDQALA